MQSKQSPPASQSKAADSVKRTGLFGYVAVGAVTFVLGFIVSQTNPGLGIGWLQQGNKNGVDVTQLKRVQSLVNDKFDGDVDLQKQSEGAIAGLVAALGDPYTVYLDAKANEELSNDLSGTLSGIGVEVGIKNNRLTVIAPIDETPAQKAGIRSGDIIARINGVDTSGMTIDDAVSKIRGPKGTTVKLTIVRASDSPKELEITRDTISVPSVKLEQKDGIGTLRIRRFGDDTVSLVENAAQTFRDNNVRGVILDLRGNPGGYLQSAVDVASQFMSRGVVVEERSRKGLNEKKSVSGLGQLTDVPLVVLIDEGSASAAEILAGALRDNGRAQLVGVKSFGKGSVQEILGLGNGTSLKVTIAHWFTPKGVNIGKEGIKPDVEVKLSDADYEADRDPQLDKAIELLKAKI